LPCKHVYLRLATSPAAIEQFQPHSVSSVTNEDAPLVRFSPTELGQLLRHHRERVVEQMMAKNKQSKTAANQDLESLLALLDLCRQVTLSQRTGAAASANGRVPRVGFRLLDGAAVDARPGNLLAVVGVVGAGRQQFLVGGQGPAVGGQGVALRADEVGDGADLEVRLGQVGLEGGIVGRAADGGIEAGAAGEARVDRRKFVDVVVRTDLPVALAREQTGPRVLTAAKGKDGTSIKVRVHPGDVQVIDVVVGKR